MSRVLEKGKNQITQKYKKGIHNGIDIVKEKASLEYIVAHSNGVVAGLRKDYKTTDKTGHSYGNYVKIKHDNGMYTLYAHLKYNSVLVSVGQNVQKGERIGFMGNTGHSKGAHLHFEVRDTNDVKIDPTPYLDSDLPNIEKPKEEPKQEKPKEQSKEEKDNPILNLVKRTIRGDFGNGENRKRALGDNYKEVQRQVDLNFKNKTTKWNKVKIYK